VRKGDREGGREGGGGEGGRKRGRKRASERGKSPRKGSNAKRFMTQSSRTLNQSTADSDLPPPPLLERTPRCAGRRAGRLRDLCVRACVRVCVCVCVRACVRVCVCVLCVHGKSGKKGCFDGQSKKVVGAVSFPLCMSPSWNPSPCTSHRRTEALARRAAAPVSAPAVKAGPQKSKILCSERVLMQ
jgi:hypothetical protein